MDAILFSLGLLSFAVALAASGQLRHRTPGERANRRGPRLTRFLLLSGAVRRVR
jgi:hypothetical protein